MEGKERTDIGAMEIRKGEKKKNIEKGTMQQETETGQRKHSKLRRKVKGGKDGYWTYIFI